MSDFEGEIKANALATLFFGACVIVALSYQAVAAGDWTQVVLYGVVYAVFAGVVVAFRNHALNRHA